MWVEFVVGSRPCSDGSSLDTRRVFLPPQYQHLPNSNSTWKQWTNSHSVNVPLKFLFIYLFIYLLVSFVYKIVAHYLNIFLTQ